MYYIGRVIYDSMKMTDPKIDTYVIIIDVEGT